MRVHLLVNTHRPDAIEAARGTALYLREHRALVASDAAGAQAIGVEALDHEALGQADLMIGFGGDGTVIRCAHLCAKHQTPILGVYFGKFGFVTQCQPSEIGAALSQFFDGGAMFEDRMMVHTRFFREGREIAQFDALNEAVVQRTVTTRMLEFQVTVNGRHLSDYPADGVLVATPTGSSAYNLSAGGPIVDPAQHCLILTAVMPHTLTTRPLVLAPSSEIHLRVETRGDAILSCDGQVRMPMQSGDEVRVTKSDVIARLMVLDPNDFYNKLSERLFLDPMCLEEE